MAKLDSIHSDGTVELIQRWRPGGARGGAPEFTEGERYIFAVFVAGDFGEGMEFHAVTAERDDDGGFYFLRDDGEEWIAWDWSEVEWFIPSSDFDFPR